MWLFTSLPSQLYFVNDIKWWSWSISSKEKIGSIPWKLNCNSIKTNYYKRGEIRYRWNNHNRLVGSRSHKHQEGLHTHFIISVFQMVFNFKETKTGNHRRRTMLWFQGKTKPVVCCSQLVLTHRSHFSRFQEVCKAAVKLMLLMKWYKLTMK